MEYVEHEFGPFYDTTSKVLILGSIPSKKSRAMGFYYAHPQNRFWKTLAAIYNEEVPTSIEEQKQFLSNHHIALWDVIKSCYITGSSDQSIRQVTVNDISSLLKKTNIQAIFTTGRKSMQLYQKYCFQKTGIPAIYLPSPSPANCKKGIEKWLQEEYQIIKQYTDEKESLS